MISPHSQHKTSLGNLYKVENNIKIDLIENIIKQAMVSKNSCKKEGTDGGRDISFGGTQ